MKKLLLIVVFALLPHLTDASMISIEIDAGSENINAVEGTVHLPTGISVEEVRIGGSAVLFWMERPEYDGRSQTIRFAGTTPGGFSGKRDAFSIIAGIEEWQVSGIWFSDVRAARSDGEGTPASVRLSAALAEEMEDVAPPESIYIEVSDSEDIFRGQTFVSFVSQDKGSGVVRYEVAEKLLGRPADSDWQEAVSPYEVRDSLLIKKVYLKAIDALGNERVGTALLPRRIILQSFFGIIIMVVCVTYVRRSRARVS